MSTEDLGNGRVLQRPDQAGVRDQIPLGSVEFKHLGADVKKQLTGSDYDFVVGSAADLAAGIATHDDFPAVVAVANPGDSVRILKTYVPPPGAIVLTKKLQIKGQGNDSNITATGDTFTIAPANNFGHMDGVRFGGDLVTDGDGWHILGWQEPTHTITGTGVANNVKVVQE